MIDTRQRSRASEIMDDFDMSGPTLRDSLDQIARINRWLGGNQVTLSGVKQLCRDTPSTQTLHIVDLGCGNGDLLRIVARWGRRTGRTVQLTGIDANADTIAYAEACSSDYPEISYRTEYVPSLWLRETAYDVVLCTLFLHHFSSEDLLDLLGIVCKHSRIGVVVNDLHRHRLAYILFWLLTFPISNRMVREDGLVSILRGFKRQELQQWTQQLQPVKSSIRWRWAFRYQWLLQPINQQIRRSG